MIPQKITLTNIGMHAHTVLDFSDVPSVFAIVGNNGCGKSTLVESVLAVFWGSFPSYPGPIYEMISTGKTEGEIELYFGEDNCNYRSCRTFRRQPSGRTKQTAVLEEIAEDGTKQLIGGPKVTEYEAAVVNLLGSESLAKATWFASQGAKGDLVNAQPGERREVLGQLLDFGGLDAEAKRLGDLAKHYESKADGILAGVASDWSGSPFTDAVTSTKAEIETVLAEAEGCQRRIKEISREHTETSLNLQKLKANNDHVDEAYNAYQSQQRIAEQRKELLAQASKRVQEIKAVVDDMPEVKILRERVAKHSKELEEAREKHAQYERYHNWNLLRCVMVNRVTELKADVQEMESGLGKSLSIANAVKAHDEVSKTLKYIRSRNSVVAENVSQCERDIAGLEAEVKQYGSRLDELRDNAKSKPETPGEDSVRYQCTFVTECFEIPSRI